MIDLKVGTIDSTRLSLDDVKTNTGTSTATVVSIVASIFAFFSFVLVAAFFYHRQKLRRAKKQLNEFIKRFNIGDPEGLVSPSLS